VDGWIDGWMEVTEVMMDSAVGCLRRGDVRAERDARLRRSIVSVDHDCGIRTQLAPSQ
jgi:hypothetical protein